MNNRKSSPLKQKSYDSMNGYFTFSDNFNIILCPFISSKERSCSFLIQLKLK